MLTVEYITEHNCYLIVPVLNRHESKDVEYVFDDFLPAKEFIDAYFSNPHAAHFAYMAVNFPSLNTERN